MIENKNLILAVVLSVAVLLGFELYFKNTRPTPPQTAETAQSAQPGQAPGQAPTGTPGRAAGTPGDAAAVPPQAPGTPAASAPDMAPQATRAEVLAATPRVTIKTPRLAGSISLRGGRLDDLILADYRETLKKNSPAITLLSPRGVKDAYFAEFGWIAAAAKAGQPAVKVPDSDTVWRASGTTLTPDTPVTLTWDNGQGLVFSRTYEIDKNFMFKITQAVANKGTRAVELFPYGLVSRQGTPKTSGFYILHEGLLGVNNGELKEVKYDEIQEQKLESSTGPGGWIGITDKYWLTALVPNKDAEVTKRYVYRKSGIIDTYQVDFLGGGVTVAPGTAGNAENRLFAGAKQVKVLDAYEESLGIQRFDLAIDWGWFYFLTRPIFYGLLWLETHVGNLGIAILLLTVGIKLAFFPLANKSYESMSKMKKLQPEMVKLRERYGDDKVKLNEEMIDRKSTRLNSSHT